MKRFQENRTGLSPLEKKSDQVTCVDTLPHAGAEAEAEAHSAHNTSTGGENQSPAVRNSSPTRSVRSASSRLSASTNYKKIDEELSYRKNVSDGPWRDVITVDIFLSGGRISRGQSIPEKLQGPSIRRPWVSLVKIFMVLKLNSEDTRLSHSDSKHRSTSILIVSRSSFSSRKKCQMGS